MDKVVKAAQAAPMDKVQAVAHQGLPFPAPAVVNTVVLTEPLPVLGAQYCCPYAIDLKIVTKLVSLSDRHFDIMDSTDSIVFRLKGKLFSLHDRRHLFDAAGNVVATLKANLVSLHDRWLVYRGESDSHKDLVFTAKRSSVLQFKTNLDIFLATEKDKSKLEKKGDDFKAKEKTERGKRIPDYRVSGSWNEKACSIYVGDSNEVAAKMIEKMTAVTLVMGNDHFGVSVFPFVDYAFIVTLIIILDAIHKENKK